MNDTWSVRPVLSSTTGEYFAMSLGRCAGTDCGLGSTGVEPTWSNRSGFSSGMLKLYFRPSTWNAWLTASAVASRNACAAARLCSVPKCRAGYSMPFWSMFATITYWPCGPSGSSLPTLATPAESGAPITCAVALADGEPDASPADDLEVRVARRRGSGERRDVRLGVEPGADQSDLLVVEETDLDRPLGVRAGGLVPAQQGLELGHAHRLAGPGVVHGAVAPVAAAHGAHRRGAAGRGTVGDAGRGGRAVVVPGDQRRLAGARLATVAAGIYEVLSS